MTDITIDRAVVERALEALIAAYQGKDGQGQVTEAITALRAALAQQAEPVEPVAEARYDGTLRWLEPHGVGLHRIQGPLYTAPPQRKPLTDEEIDAVWDQWFGAYGLRGPAGPYTRRGFARAVERALEEKNRGR